MECACVTVVIPIYNVEKYLDRCMESVVNQTYRNLEIILVDDGSPDRCPEMCDEWATRDSRIKVVHKKNAGLGMARNTGIEHATGNYIFFLDSDDYMKLDTIETACAVARKEAAEVVVFGLETIDKSGRCTASIVPNPTKPCYRGREVQEFFLPNLIGKDPSTGYDMNIQISACTCLYSMELIRKTKWRFVSEREIISEDVYSLLDLYGYVESVAVIPEAFYSYCENEVSLSRTYRKDRYEQIKEFYDACLRLYEAKEYSKVVRERLCEPYLANTIGALKQIENADLPLKERKKTSMQILKDPHLYQVLSERKIIHEKWTKSILYVAILARQYGLARFLVILKTKLLR